MEKYYTQQELCNAIYYAITWSDVPLSRRDICDKIQRKKGPHIIKMIEHLADTGFIVRGMGESKFHKPMMIYYKASDCPDGQPCQ